MTRKDVRMAILISIVICLIVIGFVGYQSLTMDKPDYKVVLTPWCGSHTPVAELPCIPFDEWVEIGV